MFSPLLFLLLPSPDSRGCGTGTAKFLIVSLSNGLFVFSAFLFLPCTPRVVLGLPVENVDGLFAGESCVDLSPEFVRVVFLLHNDLVVQGSWPARLICAKSWAPSLELATVRKRSS